MSDIAIRVDGLGKRYRIGRKKEKYRTLRDVLSGGVRSAFRRQSKESASGPKDIWALRNASFELKRGRVLGVIGSNGAGKSTLLKLLSRITEPTAGYAEMHGRVGSLLEVGTGFHQELTGRENVFLNGAVLGMGRSEILRKFDDIVEFSGIDDFIDTPVKRYSTGMYLRLAFAVAAHLEPEILLVDEVLAVGDASFQKKCMGKLGDVVHEGRTVLLVSHNMAAIKQLADEVILVERGQIVYHGEPSVGIRKYFEANSAVGAAAAVDTANWEKRSGNGGARITRIEVVDHLGTGTNTIGTGQAFQVCMDVETEDQVPILIPGIEVRTGHGLLLAAMQSATQQIVFGPFAAKSKVSIKINVPGLPVYPGEYVLDAWIAAKISWKLDHLIGAMKLNVVSQGVYACEANLNPKFERGLILCDCDWKAELQSEVVAA